MLKRAADMSKYAQISAELTECKRQLHHARAQHSKLESQAEAWKEQCELGQVEMNQCREQLSATLASVR